MSKSEIDFSTIGTYNVITPLSLAVASVTAYLTPVSSFPNLTYCATSNRLCENL